MKRLLVLGVCFLLMFGISVFAEDEQTMKRPASSSTTPATTTTESSVADTAASTVTMTIPDGTTAATDVYVQSYVLTNNDADADGKGVKFLASATTNAAANSYEFFWFGDCAENTAGACIDGLLLTSSGINDGLVDAIDVSASNITNGINLGGNILLMSAGVINADTLAVTTTDDMTHTVTAGAGGEDMIFDQNGNFDASILISTEGSGADAVQIETITNGGDIVITSVDNVNILTTTAAGEVNLGANAVEQVVSVGNATAASSLALWAGTGNFTLNGNVATTYTIGNAAQTGTMSFGNSTGNMQLDIGAGIGIHTLNIGTGGTGANVMTLGGGTGTLAIDTGDWDIGATGIATGFGNITSDGTITDGTWAVAGGTHSGIADLGTVTTADLNGGSIDATNIGAGTPGTGSFTTIAGSGAATWSGNDTDVTLSGDNTNGNALAKNEYVGLPRIKQHAISTMANGTTNTRIVDIGDSQTPATDWTAVDADTTMTNDATYFRESTASLKMAILGTATENDGCINTLGSGDIDMTDDEGFGFWMYADAVMAGSILQVVLSDSVAADVKFNIPAYPTANVWQWIEVDATTANANKDVVEDITISLTATGETQAGVAAWNVYFDFFVIWDVAEEESLGEDVPYDGVLSLVTVDVTTGTAVSANLVEYTDYFTHYQSTDAIVVITDQSSADLCGIALIAYE